MVAYTCDAGQRPQTTAPCQLHSQEGKQPIYLKPFCTPINHSVLSFSVQNSVNYMKYSMLYYKIGFELDDFVYLSANISVLMFTVG